MKFEARIFIQGAITYVPHTERQEILALMPRQSRVAEVRPGPSAYDLCRHYTVVQMSLQAIDPNAPDLWTTLDVGGHWVGYRSNTTLSASLSKNGKIEGVPALGEILDADGLATETTLDPKIVTDPYQDGRLQAGVILDSGVLSRASEYEGKFEFFSPRQRSWGPVREMSNTLKIELGNIDELTLLLRPFGTDQTKSLALRAPAGTDELEVWFRYFCDLSRPGTAVNGEPAGEPALEDPDFVLNYALLPDFDGLITQSKGMLPYPRFARSWARGNPIGIEPRKCTPASMSATSYEKPKV